MAAPNSPRRNALRQVGGRRRGDASVRRLAWARASSRVRGRPRRPRLSISPGLGAAMLAAALSLRLRHRGTLRATQRPIVVRARCSITCRRGVEAAQRDVGGQLAQRRLRDQADDLGRRPAARRGRRRARAPARSRRRAGPRPGRGRWSRPVRGRRGRRRSRARPPSPPPDSRSSAATARATSTSPVSSSTLNAASGGRAVTSVAPAVGCGSAGPKSATSSPAAHPLGELGEPAARERRRARARLGSRGELAVEEDRHPEVADRGRRLQRQLGGRGSRPSARR